HLRTVTSIAFACRQSSPSRRLWPSPPHHCSAMGRRAVVCLAVPLGVFGAIIHRGCRLTPRGCPSDRGGPGAGEQRLQFECAPAGSFVAGDLSSRQLALLAAAGDATAWCRAGINPENSIWADQNNPMSFHLFGTTECRARYQC